MAHIPPSAAIFSPSIARLASSAAKDWNYVDTWLSTRFPGRNSPPPFERNPETLKALVTLAALNETVDEDRALVASVEASALHTLAQAQATIDGAYAGNNGDLDPKATSASPAAVAESITTAIEGDLSLEGRSAFDSLATTSLELGLAYPTPALLGRKIAELQTRLFQLEQALARTDILREYMEDESMRLQSALSVQGHAGYRPSTSLAKLNLDLQRKIKKETARLQEAREKSGNPRQFPEPTVQQVAREEDVYSELLAYGKVIDKQIEIFQGLPPDKDLARQQLEALRAELHSATQRRDKVFEGLVEKATPKRPN